MTTDVTSALRAAERTSHSLLCALEGLTDDLVVGPSRLPGWTRGHVLAHLADLGRAVSRQLESAVADEVVEFYVGGRPARDAGIEAGAGASAQEHVTRVREAVGLVESAAAQLGAQAWGRPTGYRDRPASAVALLWWREVAIHLTDLDLGPDHSAWDAPFREHLAEYLTPRVPPGVRLDLAPSDLDEPRSLGTGEPVTLRGAANDLLAWLAGRSLLGEIRAESRGGAVDLPVLNAWP